MGLHFVRSRICLSFTSYFPLELFPHSSIQWNSSTSSMLFLERFLPMAFSSWIYVCEVYAPRREVYAPRVMTHLRFLIHRGTTVFSQPLAFFLPDSVFFRLPYSTYFVFVTFLHSLPLQDLFGGSATCLFIQVLAAGPFSFVTPSCGGAVDGYLQWCTTFVWTSQGTDVACAQSLLLFCLKQKITTSFTDYFDTASGPCLQHTPRLMGRCVHW